MPPVTSRVSSDLTTWSYCRHWQASENRLDPVIGRSREVARVMQILARRRKNNPILLGEPGVGKTAIAEGLALAIVNGKGDDGTELPPFLKGAPRPLASNRLQQKCRLA